MQPLVYVIILNWRSAQDTIECVESVQKSDYSNYKILLIDNGSPDDSEKILRRHFPSLELIQTGKNLGYGAGNNIGIRYALNHGAEFVWILNPDIRVEENSLNLMVNAVLSNPMIGVCGPRLEQRIGADITRRVYVDGSHYYENDLEGHVNYSLGNNLTRPEVFYVSDLLGCSMLIRGETLRNIGLFREDFFLYLEDTDFNFRAREKGWEIAVCTRTVNIHLNMRNDNTKLDSYYERRNHMLFARVHKIPLSQAILWTTALEKVPGYLKKKDYRSAIWHLMRIQIAPLIMGLFKRLQPIPDAMLKAKSQELKAKS